MKASYHGSELPRATDMMRPDAHVAVFVCVAPVDMRKQAATLALIVEQTLKRNVFEPALYVFSNERRDRIKIVYWQRNGLCLWSKRASGSRATIGSSSHARSKATR
jgi:transposase